ncbi:Uma2 family endonuclease [Myxococcus sp. AS-1-15]|uniref:Uma2 family endonuclease n=1 Tax=Myxococcus sp. AS-1-15 TaxID=2874600 RepID=UPI001CBD0047
MGDIRGTKPRTYEDIETPPLPWVAEPLEALWPAPMPRAAVDLNPLVHRLGALLVRPFDWARSGPGGWWFLETPELHLESGVVVPPLAAWRRAEVPEPPEPEAPWLTPAPDWVCEVLSSRSGELSSRMQAYHQARVEHVWLIDPARCRLEVYRRGNRGWARVGVHEGSARMRAEPFDAVVLDLGELWLQEPTLTAGTPKGSVLVRRASAVASEPGRGAT